MDFDKEAREICAPLLNPEPHPFQSEWSDIHSMCTCDLLTNIERALRRTFLAGQESMRNRIADGLRSEAVGETSLAHAIRSTPLLEEPEKEVVG